MIKETPPLRRISYNKIYSSRIYKRSCLNAHFAVETIEQKVIFQKMWQENLWDCWHLEADSLIVGVEA